MIYFLKKVFLPTVFLAFLFSNAIFSATAENIFNPKIGANADFIIEGSLNNQGTDGTFENQKANVYLRSAELIFGASIDPYADFNLMILYSESGSELHDASFIFSDVFGLKVKGGIFLANFGRWNQFHIHSMPFASEPFIYRELNDGYLLQKGLEISYLLPFDFYIETTFLLYHKLQSDTHDLVPFETKGDTSVDAIAAQLGLTDKHGSGDTLHWHDPNNGGALVFLNDLYALATKNGIATPQDPLVIDEITSWKHLTYGMRIKSILEIGEDWSIDLGSSIVYRPANFRSQRIKDKTYFRSLAGGDITVFYHPLNKNAYQNVQFGVEWLANWQEMEELEENATNSQNTFRQGVFCYCNFHLSPSFAFGFNCNLVQKRQINLQNVVTIGSFITHFISHFQYLRLEYDYYSYPNNVQTVVAHRMVLQYNVTIGYHSHGVQR